METYKNLKSSYDNFYKSVKTAYDQLLEVYKEIDKNLAEDTSKSQLSDTTHNIFRSETLSIFLYFANAVGNIREKEKEFINYVTDEQYAVEELRRKANIQQVSFFIEPTISVLISNAIDCSMTGKEIILKGTDTISRYLYNFYEVSVSLLAAMNGFSNNERIDLQRFLDFQLQYINKNNTALTKDLERGEIFPPSMIYELSIYILFIKPDENDENSKGKCEAIPVNVVNNTAADITESDFKSSMSELNDLVGLENIKTDVSNLISLVKIQKIRESKGLNPVPVSKHLVFAGNPGTGKTTVARILAQLYKEIGVLSKGQLVEVSRADLVAGYVGQTAIKTQEKINEAMGGILFIDEAYTLAKDGNDFGQEAIDTILKEMEDHRDDFIVIVAGYTDLMEKFINSNPGLKSRFSKVFTFEDYTAPELVSIFDKMCSKYDYRITDEAHNIVTDKIYKMERNKDDNFANARDIRNYFEQIITRQATRAASLTNPSYSDITTISEEDV